MIRFAEPDDEKKLYDLLLSDAEGRRKLNVRGKGKFVSNDGWAVTFVADDGGEIKGFVKISADAHNGGIYLNDLYVRQDSRRTGVGLLLYKFAKDYAIENWPASYIYAYTIENKQMESFLTEEGFECKGVYRDLIYREGKYYSQSLFMKKL